MTKPIICVALALALSILACGSSNTGQVVGTSAPGATAAPAKVQTYNVGEVVKVQSHTITLNSAEISGGKLKANFTIDNQGTSDLAISSLVSFSAKNGDGTKLQIEIFDCGSSQLDGKVLPGDKLKGDICWSGAVSPAKIYYEPSLLGSGAIVWEVK